MNTQDHTEIDAASKANEIVELLKDYSPQIHSSSDEEGYEYLENGCYCITIKNDDLIYIDFDFWDDEFTVSFGGWHDHYRAQVCEYEALKKDLFAIINNEKCAVYVKCNDDWMCSFSVKKDASKDDIREEIKKTMYHPEFRKKLKKYGAIVWCSYWDSTLNKKIVFEPNEIR